MKLHNPILPGFHPDPSVVQVGQDYYMATSTFEWWPGVEIFHSRNLCDWELVAAPLQTESKASLWGNYNSGSIWAPHLSYSEGRFWLAYTDVKSSGVFKDTLNYVITAPNITGPWSDPVFVSASGFDPSFFHDEDGKHYFLNMLFDHRPGHTRFAGTVIQEFDADRMCLVGRRRHFYTGTSLGVCEGPQILRKDGYYYLLCAAGGTSYEHAATVARCRNLEGPFEESPFFPLLTSADSPDCTLQKSGHACFLEYKGEWYITHLCARPLSRRGNCVLGREAALQKIRWVDGWPQLCSGTHLPEDTVEIPTDGHTVQKRNFSERIDFGACSTLPASMKTLRGPLRESAYSFSARNGFLRLYGEQSLISLHRQTLLARRWQAFSFDAETWMEFSPENFQQMAGLILFYDTENWAYAHMAFDEERQGPVLNVLKLVGGKYDVSCRPMPWQPGTPAVLRAKVRGKTAQFFCSVPGGEKLPLGEEFNVEFLSDDYIMTNSRRMAFTGAMVGICAQDMDRHTSFADFKYFAYTEK